MAAPGLTCYGTWDDAQMLPPLGWSEIPSSVQNPAGDAAAAITACAGPIFTASPVCVASIWCALGVVAMCGLAICAYACARTRCWQRKETVEETMKSGQQEVGTVDGTKQSTQALSQIHDGMSRVVPSFAASVTQYKYSNGHVFQGTIDSQAFYKRVSRMFQTCDCSGPRC
ncbi:hypothetical protein EMPS_03964 [Entomortierella parvispora]|uniref:Uncharacterized protein n=1 Tax=Entomortierella parvispora TaxID=205924 RepID=A0A9P3H7Q8_9FUNG|nr:hypothetical protein EMPS_03964 [Entomortierella parvispora]